jgi:hypothetical protein
MRRVIVCALALCGCSAEARGVDVGANEEEIIGGQLATAYPEAAYLDIDMTSSGGWACSAALIAPRVILTAGHCVDGHSKWAVHVGTEACTSASGATYDWNEHGATTVNPQHHDIGLVFLDQAITLKSYPTLAKTAVANGAKVTNVGRINNGTLTNALYAADTGVSAGASVGYPYDYVATDVIQPGDSGGPDFASGTHTIVAVNSGAGGGTEVLARVDLVYDWIQQQIAAHGGAAIADAGAPDASPPDASPPKDAGAPPPDAGGSSCAGTAEAEPNNAWGSAQALGVGTICAQTIAGDDDWFAVAAGAGATSIELAGSADATMAIGQASGSTCTPTLTGLRQISLTLSAAEKLCVHVSTASKTAQKYTLARK